MKTQINNIKELLINTIFPPLCLSCQSNLNSKKDLTRNLCEECFDKIKINEEIIYHKTLKNEYILASASFYENRTVRNLIHTLKYRKIKNTIKPLNEYVIKPYLKNISNIFENKSWTIIPIPLHSSKQIKRGFNQSNLIAEKIKRDLEREGIVSEIKKGFIIKSIKTKSQTKLKNKERKRNIKNSFEIKDKKVINNENIILVDDVYTTGSTTKEAVKLINKTSNIKETVIFTAAKTK